LPLTASSVVPVGAACAGVSGLLGGEQGMGRQMRA